MSASCQPLECASIIRPRAIKDLPQLDGTQFFREGLRRILEQRHWLISQVLTSPSADLRRTTVELFGRPAAN